MTVKRDCVKVLFDKETKEKALQMFDKEFDFAGNKDRMPIEKYDLSLRLYKPTSKYVNLELLLTTQFGRCFHPIGFYDNENYVWILNEYVETFLELSSSGEVIGNPKILDKKSNAVIAAFSLQTLEIALNILDEFVQHGWEPKFQNNLMIPPKIRYDKRFICNGFECELLMSTDGFPQFFLDDKHKLEGSIGAYIIGDNDHLEIHPTIEYEKVFNQLSKFELLTAFTRL